ncbi:putative dolichyl-diphosphooligosaccharide-protein glycosyltransferase 48kd subunit, partial [Globisporangium splendens]
MYVAHTIRLLPSQRSPRILPVDHADRISTGLFPHAQRVPQQERMGRVANVVLQLAALFACLMAAVAAARTAVVLESLDMQQTHSKFFAFLSGTWRCHVALQMKGEHALYVGINDAVWILGMLGRGHELSFFSNDPELTLEKYGVRTYDNLVIFSPQKKLGKLSKVDLLHFVETGGNILLSSRYHYILCISVPACMCVYIALISLVLNFAYDSAKLTKVQREFALECGVEYEKKGNLVMDHVNPIADDSDIYNSIIAATDFVASDRVVGSHLASTTSKNKKPVAFASGLGMTLEPNNILGFHALVAPATAYSANPVKEITSKVIESDLLFGNEIGLVTAIQARNNARLVFAGSVELFSDKYFTDAFSNAEFSKAVSKWAFQESGVLRVTNVHHRRADGSNPDKMLKDSHRGDQPLTLYPDAEIARDSLVYRIKDNLTYSFDIHELKDGKWVPYAASDVQLEFVMLDPYVRKTMTHDNKGHFSVTFEAPDAYGIFLFRVMYRRLGLSTLQSSTQVSLRPFKHDEYERFIPAAYPYYVSAFSMMAGVFVFSAFFLFYQEKKHIYIRTLQNNDKHKLQEALYGGSTSVQALASPVKPFSKQHTPHKSSMPPAKKVANGVKTDGLFSWVEEREALVAETSSSSSSSWGRVLDAGTGRHSLSWLLGFAARTPNAISEVVAVTGEQSLADTLTKEFKDHAANVPTRIYAGNWVDDAFLKHEEVQKFDVVIAGAMHMGCISTHCPILILRLCMLDAIIERISRHLAPGGRLYLIGLQPLSESSANDTNVEDDVTAAKLVQEMARVRDACILLAGRRCYREFPMTWCERQLQVAGFTVDASIKLANIYKRETVMRQLQVAKNQFIWFNDENLQRSMEAKIKGLEKRAARLFDGGKKIRFGFDYVLAATKKEQ